MKFSTIYIVISIITIFNTNSLFGQNPSIYIAYETANFTNDYYKGFLTREGNNTPSVKLGLDFKLSHLIILGGYFNYTRFANPELYSTTYIVNDIEQQREWYGFSKSNALTLGTKIYFKLLPLFYKERDLRVDLYSTSHFALLYNFTKNKYIKSGITPEYGLGIGLGYLISNKIRIFGETTFGEFYNDKGLRWTFGIKHSL